MNRLLLREACLRLGHALSVLGSAANDERERHPKEFAQPDLAVQIGLFWVKWESTRAAST